MHKKRKRESQDCDINERNQVLFLEKLWSNDKRFSCVKSKTKCQMRMVANVQRVHFRKIHACTRNFISLPAIRAIRMTAEKTNMYTLDNHSIVTGSPTTKIPSKHIKKYYSDNCDRCKNRTKQRTARSTGIHRYYKLFSPRKQRRL